MKNPLVYSRVLVPTDQSPRAARALPHAYAVVAPTGTVELVHVLHQPAAPNPLYAHYSHTGNGPEQEAEQREAAKEALDALLRSCPPPPGVTVRTHVVTQSGGLVADAICALAEELGADVVCIASHGRTGLRRAWLGSVADLVVHRCGVPTLVVRVPKAELVES